jgi:hypothetical protein
MWESRSVFCGGFSKQFVEIIKKKLPKATFADFHQLRHFPQPLAPADFSVRGRGDRYT